jgi:hypothetical protein
MLAPVTEAALLAYHGTNGGGGATGGFIFLGIVATAGWVLFSKLRWRNTMLITGSGWLVLLSLLFVL